MKNYFRSILIAQVHVLFLSLDVFSWEIERMIVSL